MCAEKKIGSNLGVDFTLESNGYTAFRHVDGGLGWVGLSHIICGMIGTLLRQAILWVLVPSLKER